MQLSQAGRYIYLFKMKTLKNNFMDHICPPLHNAILFQG